MVFIPNRSNECYPLFDFTRGMSGRREPPPRISSHSLLWFKKPGRRTSTSHPALRPTDLRSTCTDPLVTSDDCSQVALTRTRLATAVDVLNRSTGWRPLVENAAGRGGEPSIPGIMDPTASITASEVKSATEDTPFGTELAQNREARKQAGGQMGGRAGGWVGRRFVC